MFFEAFKYPRTFSSTRPTVAAADDDPLAEYPEIGPVESEAAYPQ
jgi:hypothetical protein